MANDFYVESGLLKRSDGFVFRVRPGDSWSPLYPDFRSAWIAYTDAWKYLLEDM